MKLLLMALISVSVMAAGQAMIVVKGIVVSFDEKKITLKQKKTLVYVPRSTYPDLRKVKIGRTVIEVETSPKQFLDLNPIFKK